MLLSARSPSSGEEQEAGSITLRPRLRHPGTSQSQPRLLHASPSPTASLVLGHRQPRPPRLSHHPGRLAASSPATRSFHCPSRAAPEHAQQSSAPFPFSHWLLLPNCAETRLAVSHMPRLCSLPGQGRGFYWLHPLGAGSSSQALGSCLGRARLGSVCSSGGGGQLG